MVKKVYLIGDPVGHSVSPAMHNSAYDLLGLDYHYETLRVEERDLKTAIDGFRDPEVAGANVTVPHKESVIKFLDRLDDLASLIGAVNTIKNDKGRLVGYNTDAVGFKDSLIDDAKYNPVSKKVLLIGAGGAAKAVAVALCTLKVKEIVITDIDRNKAEDLADNLKKDLKTQIKTVFDRNGLNSVISQADLIVNATPIGMSPKIDGCPIDESSKLKTGAFVYDLVYNPSETKLVKLAKANGAGGITGLGMLVRQGAAAFKIFTGKEPPVDVMREAAERALGL